MSVKRIAQRNPRRLRRGKIANRDITSMPLTNSLSRVFDSLCGKNFLCLEFEDSPRLAAGSFKKWGLIFFWVFFLTACKPPLTRDPATLVYNLSTEPATLNLLTSQDAYASRVNAFVYDSLLDRDNRTLLPIPRLALRWEESSDHLQYTFYLRKDVKWHDGKLFNADDVIYSYQRIQDPKVDADHLRDSFEDIQSIEKIDDYTIRCTWKKAYFKALETCGGLPIVAKHDYEVKPASQEKYDFNSHEGGRRPIGTGPFKFVEWKTGRQIVLERNEDYWDKTRLPSVRKLVFKFIHDEKVTLQKLKKQELDFGGLSAFQWVNQTSSETFKNNFNKYDYYSAQFSYIGWNFRNPIFQDKRVRRALTMLLNRQAILEKLEFGLGEVLSGPFFVKADEYDSSIKPYPFDPQAAKKLLEEAGWKDSDGDGRLEKDGNIFEFTLVFGSGNRFAERLATIFKEDLRKVGIQMKIEQMEFATLIGKVVNQQQFDAVCMGWSFDIVDFDPYGIWHSSQTAPKQSNFIGFKNNEVDSILEQARTTFDRPKRIQLYRRLHAILYEEQPYTLLFARKSLLAVAKRFQGVQIYRHGTDLLEWKVEE